MSIIVASGDTISKNILNQSKSKAMYSFPKEKRFDMKKSATYELIELLKYLQ